MSKEEKIKFYQNEIEKMDKEYFDIGEECYGCRMYLMCLTCPKAERSEMLRKKMSDYKRFIDRLVMESED